MWGALSDGKSGRVGRFSFYRASPAQPFSDPSSTGLVSIFSLNFWDPPPKLEGQVPVFISPRNKVAQLYTGALGFLMKHWDNFHFANYFTHYVKPEVKLPHPTKRLVLKKTVHVMK
jgi:hypothetical protein